MPAKLTVDFFLRCGFKYSYCPNKGIKFSYSLWEYDMGVDGEIEKEFIVWKEKRKWVIFYNSTTQTIKFDTDIFEIINNVNYNPKLNFVYIIQSDLGYKIGKSRNLNDRLKIFNVKMPFRWHFIKIFAVQTHNKTEQFLHDLFKDYRINGEWFNIPTFILPKLMSL